MTIRMMIGLNASKSLLPWIPHCAHGGSDSSHSSIGGEGGAIIAR